MIIKHPMDFGTMKDKIVAHEYKSVTEFKVSRCGFLECRVALCVWHTSCSPRHVAAGLIHGQGPGVHRQQEGSGLAVGLLCVGSGG